MPTTESKNFGYLIDHDPLLLEIATSAERAFSKDPNTTLVKLRQLAECLIRTLAAQVGVTSTRDTKFVDLITAVAPKIQMDHKVVKLLHHLRVKGNDAVHEYTQDYGDAVDALRSARELCIWYHRTFGNPRPDFKPGPFVQPRNWLAEESTLRQDIERLNTLLDQERKSASKNIELIDSLKREEEKLRLLAEERRRDADASFALAEEQSREVDRLKVSYEASLRETVALRQSEPVDFGQLAFRSQEAAKQTKAEWAPEITLADAFTDDQLTADQAHLIGELHAFLHDQPTRVFLMTGFAGTGKTFVTKGLSNFLAATGRNCVLVAPTGKAARVLTQKSGRTATTIHKKIYSTNDVKEYKVEGLDGSETYKFYAELRVNEDADNTVYIVDESSMVSDVYSEGEFFRFGSGRVLSDLFKYINLDHNDHDKKVIFIGDSAQLPPVGMSSSPALDDRYLRKAFGISGSRSYELTQVVRHGLESGILKSASAIRDAIKRTVFNRIAFNKDEADVHLLLNHEDLVSGYLTACEHKVSDNAMIIAWSNADVASLNELVRSRLFPGEHGICTRDKLVVVTNCLVQGIALNNGDLVYVRNVDSAPEVRTVRLKSKNEDTGQVSETDIKLQFRDIQIGYRDSSGNASYADVKIIENLLYNDQPSLSSDESKALYIDFRIRNPRLPKHGKLLRDELRDDKYFNALRVKFGYALTCHKAQGSEWDSAFVNCRMGSVSMSSEAYFRWVYTAITRAKNALHIFNAPNMSPWSDIKKSSLPTTPPELPSLKDATAVRGHGDLTAHGISDDNALLKQLYSAVIGRLGESAGLRVASIDHHAYQEAYFISDEVSTARVNISYNGRGVVRSIIPVPRSDLGLIIADRLAPLIGRQMLDTQSTSPGETRFAREVFNEFFPVFVARASAQGLEIIGVTEEAWNLRIVLSNAISSAEVAIYCDGKGRIKSPTWIGKPPQDASLIDAFNLTISSL